MLQLPNDKDILLLVYEKFVYVDIMNVNLLLKWMTIC